ncbi:methyltransferase-like protein 24 isoform X2 [Falco rusticolus]|uniref:methyltransferase-like protein 24 isoform X2 n=1 Tax=Falco rusticolus TaxID=120794 RepID=UPI0018869ECD|nr:methyltransferase-like protein 24 isoform X2 [Falco rusticolus]XP_055569634.1 probable methyltransferase-like protein 24 isoform X2 [Falco cherrug]XP_055666082.1 probable methyltransferase-like protein 24 isoform X2 [Falco peregrinus]
MPKERPLWRGPAFRLCLLSAVLFLCLQLGMRRSWCPEEKPRAPAAAGRAPPPARGTEQHPGAAAAGRRRVTYVRSGRRGSAAPGCCPLQPPGGRRRKISCERMNLNSLREYSETTKKPWSICLDERFSLIHRIRSKQCRLYSLGLGNDDNQFEISMANSGCEVHRFDPSIKSAHIQEGRHLWYHRLSIDWRDPNPAIAAHKLHSNTKKLGTILNEFGHQKIDVLKADVESAEWKILENLILEDVVEQIGQLVFEVHIHWPGFEVSGNDSTVVRYWYSLLRELELKDFKLFHTYKDLSKPQMFLKKEAFNASSCYTLSWVNTRWT